MKLFVFALLVATVSAQVCMDDPTGDIAAAGANCALLKGMGCDFDLNNLRPDVVKGTFVKVTCPVSCGACEDQVYLDYVKQFQAAADAEAAPATDATGECKDDPTGDVSAAGVTCGLLVGMGCGLDLQTLSPDLPVGTFVKMVCPKSCDACPAKSALANPMPAACVDDATGDIAKNGASCAMLAGMGCDFDLSTLNPTAPKGTTTSMLCPVTCDSCPPAAAAEAPTDGPTDGPSDAPTDKPTDATVVCEKQKYSIVSAQLVKKCLQATPNGMIQFKLCNAEVKGQIWTLDGNKLMHGNKCVGIDKNALKLGDCNKAIKLASQAAGFWLSENGMCNQAAGPKLKMAKCNAKLKAQQWIVAPHL